MRKESETESVCIRGVTIAPGDIVFIKFRKLEDVLRDERKLARINETLDFYQIDDHTSTFLRNFGHFKVESVASKEDYLRLNPDRDPNKRLRKSQIRAATLSNPLQKAPMPSSKQEEKNLDDYALEEIMVYDHNTDTNWHLNEILIEEIRVDNDSAESYFSERHEISLVRIDSVLYLNGLPITPADSKIFEMFEKVMADAAISKMFSDSEEEKPEEDDDF